MANDIHGAMGAVEAFLSHLATEQRVAASTQNQALSVVLFLKKEVLGILSQWVMILSFHEVHTTR